MTQSGYLLLGLTAIVGALVAVLVFTVLRFGMAAREASRRLRDGNTETAFLTTALQGAVTKLKQQELATKARAEASERLSEEILASLASGLLVVGRTGDVRVLNPAGRKLLGLSDTRPDGAFREVLGPGGAPLADAIDECLRSSRPIVRRALRMSRTETSGGVSHLGVTVSPIYDDAKTLQGAICLFTDLTEVVDLEEQLRLKDSLARLGELTAGLAHEFRNGLATVHGYARLLDLEELPPRYRSYVTSIRQETEALGEIVTNFLNFARPAELSLATVDLRRLADRAVDEIRGEVTARGGEVRIVGEFGEIQGDDVLLRQAFSNLCRNAVEACAEGEVTPVITVEGAIDREQGVVRVTVSDNGWLWRYNGPGNGWELRENDALGDNNTYYVEGDVDIGRNRTWTVTIIAEGNIDITGNGDITADTPGLLFVTDMDLDISGNHTFGNDSQILVHEQMRWVGAGGTAFSGQIVIEDAAAVSNLVTWSRIQGNITITNNGGAFTATYEVKGWREW